MRIISGKYRGFEVKGYSIEGTRPTMDRVKESLFATIQHYLKDSVCLDLFAGSGALGIESLSMGASACYFVDINKVAINALKDNLVRLHVSEEYYLIHNNFKDALNNFKDKKFDVIFLDPPYEMNLIGKSIEIILSLGLLNDGGIIVCEYEREVFSCDLDIIKEKKYGSKNIRIYRK